MNFSMVIVKSGRSSIKKKKQATWIAHPSPSLHSHFPTLLLINTVLTHLGSGHGERHEIREI